MAFFLKQFFHQGNSLFVTEFGHSVVENSKTVGPWSREVYFLHLVTKGYCEFSGFRVNEGQTFLVSKGLRHSFTVSDNYEHYWIGFGGDAADDLFKIFGLSARPHRLFFVENADFAETLFSAALQKLQNDGINTPESIAFSVLTALLPLLKKEKFSQMRKGINYAEKAEQFIKTNYAYPLRLEDIAKEIHLTEKYMYRLFLARFGISPQKFLLKTRMEAAADLFKKTDMTVKEVANSVGYNLLTSFSKAFSKYHGISPTLFKKGIISTKN